MFFSTLRASLFGLLVLMPVYALAQGQSPPAASDQQLLKAEELDALVAPIALYPDTLLAEVLMASTYPLEVVQADRWATENKTLKGDQLKTAVDKLSWDDSVKSLIATPSVLTMMSTKLDWTQKLGDAVLAQQPDVMDAVQRLRTKAQANNKLQSTKEQKVSVKQEQSKQVIVIEPAVPDTMYVPYYDPGVVYGGWPYPSYPPYYFPPPYGYVPGAILATGIAFGAGVAVGRWASGGYWGGGVNWGENNINVNRNTNINNINAGGNWQHNPQHRQGVKYNNTGVQQKFGNNNVRGGSQDRMDFRGRSGDQVLKPGGGQANLGDRGGAGNRPGGGSGGAANRPGGGSGGAANRPGGRRRCCQSSERRRWRPAAQCRPTARRRRRERWRQRPRQYSIRQNGQCAIRARARQHGWRRRTCGRRRRRRTCRWRRWWWCAWRRWRRWWPRRRWWRRTPIRYRAQARHRPSRTPRQRPCLLSVCL